MLVFGPSQAQVEIIAPVERNADAASSAPPSLVLKCTQKSGFAQFASILIGAIHAPNGVTASIGLTAALLKLFH
jgi:hypothetical protein